MDPQRAEASDSLASSERLVDVSVALRPRDVASALDVSMRTVAPFRYWALTLVGILFLVVFVGFGLVLAPADVRASDTVASQILPFFGLVWIAYLIPWCRHRASAYVGRLTSRDSYAPYRIESFSPERIRVRTSRGSSVQQLDALTRRVETRRLFVLLHASGAIGLVVRKDAFVDRDTLEAFRRVVLAPPRAAAVLDALHAFGGTVDPGAIQYLLTPSEFLDGHRLLLRVSRFHYVRWFALVFVTAMVVYVAATVDFDAELVVPIVVAVFVGSFLLQRRLVNARLLATLKTVTVSLDDDGFRIASADGEFAAPWNTLAGYLEDERVIVVAARRDLGYILPKRVLSESVKTKMRSHLAPVR